MNLINSSTTLKQQLATLRLERLRRLNPQKSKTPDLLTWTILHRQKIDPKTKSDFAHHAYLIEVYQQTAKEIVVKKAGQIGVSEWLISYAFHGCSERDMDILYLMPTDGDVSDFSQSRFGPALEASPYLDSIVVPATGTKRGTDKVTLKRIKDSFLYLRGGQVGREASTGKKRQAHKLKSIPVDGLIGDEVDEIPPAAIDLARERLGHSSIAEVRSVSTPTYPGHGVDALWQNSDQREWLVPCPHCNQWQQITINSIVIEWDELERPVTWHGQDEGQAFPACRKCGGKLDRLAMGAWVARYPGRDMVGYHPTRFASAVANLNGVIEVLRSTDESKRQECFNQALGETYTPKGSQMTAEVLDDCRRDYGHRQKAVKGEELFMGIDIGKVLHIVVRAGKDPESGEWPQRWAGEVDSFAEAGRLAKRLKVKTIVVDALPETRKAREFQASLLPGMVWLAYYLDDTKLESPLNWNEKEMIVNMDRTRSLDETYSRFFDGKNTLPANARDIKDYYDHLCAPVRALEEKKNGHLVARYVEVGPDHLAHAENYCTAAMEAPQKPKHKFLAV